MKKMIASYGNVVKYFDKEVLCLYGMVDSIATSAYFLVYL
jgi:hypothetical protein